MVEREIIMSEHQKRLFIDLHVLQTVPPSCVNRDDTGSPKTAVYGGATRARVSSQAWKRAMRLYFSEIFQRDNVGVRTKKIVGLVTEAILELAPDLQAETLAIDALKAAGLKIDDKKHENDALFLISRSQAKALAKLIVDQSKDKAQYKAALRAFPSYDMALFGRMVAADPSLNYDAAAQVAHSISTHAVHNEYDYFTAVDDCAPEDNAGAGHLGTIEYNSATLYRYATVNVCELSKHLGNDVATVVRGFVEAFVCSMPTGKQNTFANRTRPDVVYVTVRMDQPVNLCGAFEQPVRSQEGYVSQSEQRLMDYARETYANYVDAPILQLGVGTQGDGIQTQSFGQLLDTLENWIREFDLNSEVTG